MKKAIFISYRRQDSGVFTGRLFDRLSEAYGPDAVFLDIDSVPTAVDFRDVVKAHIDRCRVFLAVIGTNWEAPTEDGRRIDSPADHVRIEVEQALATRKPIIPVYCEEMEALSSRSLPKSLEPLAYMNACQIDTGRDFNVHVLRLRREIDAILFPSWGHYLPHRFLGWVRRRAVAIGACLTIALMVFLLRAPIGRLLVPRDGIHSYLEQQDPNVFSLTADETYQIVRGLPDRATLVSETDLQAAIRSTEKTLDIFAITGTSFFSNPEAIYQILQRGVRIRVILLDHSEQNRANLVQYFEHSGDPSRSPDLLADMSRDSAAVAQGAFRKFREDAIAKQTGSIELRWWQGTFLNSFWIRDAELPRNALGHVEITIFGDAQLNPSVRFGSYSPKMITGLQSHFEELWKAALPEQTHDGT